MMQGDKVGIISGGGDLPLLSIESAKKQGKETVVIALIDEADERINELSDKVHWLKVGQIIRAVEIFKESDVNQCLMMGRVPHRRMFDNIGFDSKLYKVYQALKDRKADSILEAVVNLFEKEGIKFLNSITFLKEFLAPEGIIGGIKPDDSNWRDIKFGWKLAKKVAELDVGQTVVVKDSAVIAIEAMEGTDEMILRTRTLCPLGAVVMKVAKPQQDFRFDVPVVGPDTILNMKAVNAAVLAVEAGKTILVHRDEMVKASDNNGIVLVGIDSGTFDHG